MVTFPPFFVVSIVGDILSYFFLALKTILDQTFWIFCKTDDLHDLQMIKTVHLNESRNISESIFIFILSLKEIIETIVGT